MTAAELFESAAQNRAGLHVILRCITSSAISVDISDDIDDSQYNQGQPYVSL